MVRPPLFAVTVQRERETQAMYYPAALPKQITVSGLQLEYYDEGSGPAILYLHCSEGPNPELAVVKALTKTNRVVMPAMPGFGLSETASFIRSVDDISYVLLDLIEALDLSDVTVVGSSLGGWAAVELATKASPRVARLVLDNPLGLRFATDPTVREFPDIYQDLPSQWADYFSASEPMDGRDWPSVERDIALRAARSREMFVKVGWSPYLYNPKLSGRIHRASVPALVLWGDQDKLASRDYAQSYAAALPDARLEVIAGAGHFAFLDKPEMVASAVLDFARSKQNA
jgi:pimeloyl-ACP methyl ester carboxylesterase